MSYRGAKENNKHAGLSQLIVDLSAEGVSIRPIKYLSGENHFNEVFLRMHLFQKII